LLGAGGELLSEVAEPDLDGAEELAVRGVGEGVGHALQQGGGGGLELAEEALAALVAGLARFRERRRGWHRRG
jgi:hypothetical protein